MKELAILFSLLFINTSVTAQVKPAEGLTTIPDSSINATKEKIQRGDQAMMGLLSILLEKADIALKAEATSVMDKGIVPPSGDKHDYISQGPYWWPDPNKADGLPYIRRDGEVNPEIRKFMDHDNMREMIQNVDLLAKAYFFSEKTAYAEKAIELISVWFINEDTKMNPHLEYGQGIPGRNTGRSIGIIETPGLAKVVDAIVLLRNHSKWNTSKERSMQNWMSNYLNWLITSDHGKKEAIHPNNHGTYYDIQVISLALFTNQQAIAREIIEKAKERRFDAHIIETGEQPHETARTKGFSYSTMNLKGLFQIAVMADKLNINLWNYSNSSNADLKKALDYLIPFATGDSPLPFKQISKLHPERLLPHLWMAYRVYDDQSYLRVYRQINSAHKDDLSPLFY